MAFDTAELVPAVMLSFLRLAANHPPETIVCGRAKTKFSKRCRYGGKCLYICGDPNYRAEPPPAGCAPVGEHVCGLEPQ